ncbi:MAG TPA: NAD(P)H-dependent oxidoreductase subunit E [Gemmatimonadaceae bacterium]|jgi:NADH-quinone oxidoreductase subunit F|nr:NAD(P)H-dependent oxidoreductase subunit E [Gemmatimonadaceae bacterium]
MDLRLRHVAPTDEERAAIDGLLGIPESSWEGGERGDAYDAHVAHGGREMREQRHLLLPALRALQERVGWISETGLEYVCARLGVPPADAWGVATFYALLSTTPRAPRVLHVCDDIACRCKGAAELTEQLERTIGPAHAHGPNGDHTVVAGDEIVWMRSPCLGYCDHAPAAYFQEAGAAPREELLGDLTADEAVVILRGSARREMRLTGEYKVSAPEPWTAEMTETLTLRLPQDEEPRPGRQANPLLHRLGVVDPTNIAAYRASGGFEALRRAIEIGQDAVIREVIDSKLMGRGGAAFPTGKKWEAVARQSARPHYLVCNADESEPGTFKDRVLLEGDPFAIVEAMTIAGFATGCERGFLYVRGEYPLGTARMQHAIDEARTHGFLGANILGRGARFDIEIRRGAGAYICGEETAIFNSIEGYRGEPRNKPPFPVQAGLFGLPTVVNNVETLANIPSIVLEGGAAFAAVGTEQSTGTKLFCVSGNVAKPGVYEVKFGKTLRELLEMAGGVANGRALQAVLLGGAAGIFVGPNELDIPLTFEGARAAKATLGSGVILAFDDRVDMSQILLRIASFFRDESCGQCVPCRVGTVRQEEALYRIASGKALGGVGQEVALLDEVGLAMKDASICGLGQTAYSAIESAIHRVGVFNKSQGAGA